MIEIKRPILRYHGGKFLLAKWIISHFPTHRMKGMAIISGYRCDLYDELFPEYLRVEKKAFADGASPQIECLWINPAAATKLNKKLF